MFLAPHEPCDPRAGVQYDRSVRELAPGLWHWKAPHPDWRASEPRDQNVSSYGMEDGERLLLFDPIAPSEIESLAAERETAVVLTCLRARHAGPGRAPGRAGAIFDADGPLDLAAALDLMRRHGLTPAV